MAEEQKKVEFGFWSSFWVQLIIRLVLPVAFIMWLFSPSESKTNRVGREFQSMTQCLDFIKNDMGEDLKIMGDKPGDISGQSSINKLFFRCEAKMTGTRGLVLEGRWDRLKK